MDDLKELIDSPPNEPVAPVTAIVNAIPLADEQPLLAICTNQLVLDVELPDGMVVKAQPPDWIGAALEHGSETASDMVGKLITYKWPALLGGWMVGKVTIVNTDKANKIGTSFANFEVYYEADKESAFHLLSLEKYAKSSRSKTDAWAIVE